MKLVYQDIELSREETSEDDTDNLEHTRLHNAHKNLQTRMRSRRYRTRRTLYQYQTLKLDDQEEYYERDNLEL